MKSKDVLVSISCITYNHAPYITQCLDGFLMQQTNFAIEVLIHDDCSTDGTTEIIKEYESRYPDIIKPIYEDENQYQQGKPSGSAVWNFPRAKGKYIALCEGDDYWTDPFKLQIQVDFMENNPDYGLIYTDFNLTNGEKPTYVEKYLDGIYFPHILTGRYPLQIQTLTALFRTSVYNSLPKYFLGKGWLMGDTPLWIEFSKYSKIKYLPVSTAKYRVLDNSASHSKDINKLISFRDCGRQISVFYGEKFSVKIPHNGFTANYFEVILRYAYRLNNKKVASQYFFKALLQNKLTLKGVVFYIGTIFSFLQPIIGEH